MLYYFEKQTLDLARRELIRDGKSILVEPKIFDLLVYLIENRQRVVTKDDLIAHVWGGRIVSDSSVVSAINAARKAIDDSGREQRLIRTLARKGIRFVGEVSLAGPAYPAPSTSISDECDEPAPRVASSALPVPDMSARSASFAELTEVDTWLAGNGFSKYADSFRQNEIDFGVLQFLTDEDLKHLGLSLVDRKHFAIAISQMVQDRARNSSTVPQQVVDTDVSERRQLTVVFVDLTYSGTPQSILDPEDLHDLVRPLHRAISDAIRERGGYVARLLDNGVLAYFGYPIAVEDAAERAVRASLQAIAAAGSISNSEEKGFAVRVGIATGLVVVGDSAKESLAHETRVMGEPVTLATRLAIIGPPSSVTVASATRRLIGELFALEDLPPRALEGIAVSVLPFRVTGERQILSRFEALHGSQRTPFTGRTHEISLILDRWEHAKDSDAQLILLSGEAGIGKSRVIEAVWQKIAVESHNRVIYQCTPQHSSSALYPVLAQLAAAAKLQSEDDAVVRAEKLRVVLPDVSDGQFLLVASLLGVPIPPGSTLIGMTAARKRQLLLEAFSLQLYASSQQRPAVLVVEDAHWIDPTTEELISQIVARANSQRILMIVTQRPDYTSPWLSAPIVTQLPLNRLSRTHSGMFLEALAGNVAVPPDVLSYIAARADGIPLFMEELFQALCDSGTLQRGDDAYRLVGPLESATVPVTLQDSLMARLDRLVPAKTVAQIASVVGREFEYGLLSAVANLPEDQLDQGLEQLVTAGLLFARGVAPETIYVFKHALVQDAAYASMLRQRRREIHSRIAVALARHSAATRPELVARHFEEAGNLSQAAEWLEISGDAAAKTAANQEAIRFWRRALQVRGADTADQSGPRPRIQLMLKLASVLTQVEGYGSSAALELGEAATQAAVETKNAELYLDVSTRNAPALFSRQEYDRVERQLSHVNERDLEATAAVTRARFWSVRGLVNFHLGRITRACHDLQLAKTQADRILDDEASFGGGDVRFVCRSYLARAQTFAGLTDSALATGADGLAIARKLEEPFSVAWGLATLGQVHLSIGDYGNSALALDESIMICERNGYATRLAQVLVSHGTVRLALGKRREGVREIRQGLDLWTHSAGTFSQDVSLTDAATTAISVGELDLARWLVREATNIYEQGVERAASAETLRLQAWFAESDGDRVTAYMKLHEAIKTAEQQGAYRSVLRGSYSLARMMVDDMNTKGAYNVLKSALSRVEEGHSTPDVVHAKALQEALSI